MAQKPKTAVMKKLLYILPLLLLTGLSTTAQTKGSVRSGRAYFAVTYGFALPQGNFASVEPPAAGFAKNGSQYDLEAGITPAKNFSLELDFFHARYAVKNDATTADGVFLNNWKYNGFTFGPVIKIPMGKVVEANLKIKGGVAWVKSAVDDVSSGTVNSVKSSSFILKPGVDLRFHLTQSVFLVTNLDWAYMGPKFKYANGSDLDQQISTLHLGFGIGFNF
jgi:hypothetical protein